MSKKILLSSLLILCMYVIGFYFHFYYDKTYDISQIDELVEEHMSKTSTPGMAISIVNNDNVASYTYGYEDLKTDNEVNKNTDFEIGSTTKAFTGLAVELLYESGQLDIKDNVSNYLSWFKPTYKGDVQDITIEDLLTHKSGIPVNTISKIKSGTDKSLLEDTIKSISTVKLDFMPGEQYQYATINYDVLALIIEEVTGMSYEDYVTNNILIPIGMEDSYFATDESSETSYKAQGYKYGFLHAIEYDAPYYYGNIAAGYLVTNANDIGKWLQAQLGMLDLSDELTKAIEASHNYNDGSDNTYWEGWEITSSENIISHSGSNPNYSSQVYIDLENKQAVFVMSNINGSAATEVGTDVFNLLKGKETITGFTVGALEKVDFIAMLIGATLLLIFCFIVYNRKNWRSRYIRVKLLVSICVVGAIAISPLLMGCTYSLIWVWDTPMLFVDVIFLIICLGAWLFFSAVNKVNQNKKVMLIRQ